MFGITAFPLQFGLQKRVSTRSTNGHPRVSPATVSKDDGYHARRPGLWKVLFCKADSVGTDEQSGLESSDERDARSEGRGLFHGRLLYE
jgi:hypothetical protein